VLHPTVDAGPISKEANLAGGLFVSIDVQNAPPMRFDQANTQTGCHPKLSECLVERSTSLVFVAPTESPTRVQSKLIRPLPTHLPLR